MKFKGVYRLTKIPKGLWKKVKHKCVDEDTDIRTVIIGLLESWVNGKGRV